MLTARVLRGLVFVTLGTAMSPDVEAAEHARQFVLEIPLLVYDPDANEEPPIPAWIQANRIAKKDWSDEHREAMRLIDQTSIYGDGNPAPLIHAVNYLHAMGKDGAIRVLRDYAARNPHFNSVGWRLAPIVQILFSPVDNNAVLPPREWYDLPDKTWCVGIVVRGDIPFYVFDGFSLAGSIPSAVPLVEWAALHGTMRAKPLVPAENTRQAAEQAVAAVARDSFLAKCCGPPGHFPQFVQSLKPLFYEQAARLDADRQRRARQRASSALD